MLHSKVSILRAYLEDVNQGTLLPDHAILRHIRSVSSRFDCILQEETRTALVQDQEDMALVGYLSTVIKSVNAMSEVCLFLSYSIQSLDKFQSVGSIKTSHDRKMRGLLSR